MLNAVKEIYAWQVKAGNAQRAYSDFLESSFQVEEAIEGFDNNSFEDVFPEKFPVGSNPQPKEIARHIISIAMNSGNDDVADVERLDKACDAVVYAIGSMAKLGLDHHGITKALNIVNHANVQKLGMGRDEEGKLLKPADFVGPEVHLQELLDSIKK